jgi:hypothetical protein
MDVAAMGVAFLAGFNTRLGADAARRIDVEFVSVHQALPFLDSRVLPRHL